MLRQTELSPTALCCLDRQLAEALDLAVACHQLSDQARSDGDPRTTAVLDRLASDLTDLASTLVPLVGVEERATTPLFSAGSSSGAGTWLAQLDHRLGLVGLAAEVDALSPGLEPNVARLLSKLATVYQGSRELLLAAAPGNEA
jgi:hypothetical protein